MRFHLRIKLIDAGFTITQIEPITSETESRPARPTEISMSEVTEILEQIEQGDATAAAELLPLVYAELRKLAGHRLDREKPGQTLQATALVLKPTCD